MLPKAKAIGLFFAISPLIALGTGAPSPSKPNILLITADDMGFQLGCYGEKLIKTPNLDRFAANSVLCERAYVPQSSCSPSRASLYTGLYPHQHGQMGLVEGNPSLYHLRDNVVTLQTMFKQGGYVTGMIGKLHVAPKSAFPLDDKKALEDALFSLNVEAVADWSAKFFKTYQGRPWFLVVNYFDPHNIPTEPTGYREDVNGYPHQKLNPAEVNPLPWQGVMSGPLRRKLTGFYDSCARLDEGMGLLLNKLKEAGMDENTLVIFISDNGPDFTRAKTTCYEAGVHEPLLLRWPKHLPEGKRVNGLISSLDLAPTMLTAAGLDVPSYLPGSNLLPYLQGKATFDRKYIATEFTAHAIQHFYPRRAITDGRWKLIVNAESPKTNPLKDMTDSFAMLSQQPEAPAYAKKAYDTFENPPKFEMYDISKDPCEFSNLAEKPEMRPHLLELFDALKKWQVQTQDTLALPTVPQ